VPDWQNLAAVPDDWRSLELLNKGVLSEGNCRLAPLTCAGK
jgi:hypothetical protein